MRGSGDGIMSVPRAADVTCSWPISCSMDLGRKLIEKHILQFYRDDLLIVSMIFSSSAFATCFLLTDRA